MGKKKAKKRLRTRRQTESALEHIRRNAVEFQTASHLNKRVSKRHRGRPRL